MIYLIGILSTISWIWLIVIAFRNESPVWGVLMILFSPLTLLFGLLRWNICKIPYLILLVSIALAFTLSAKDLQSLSLGSAADAIPLPEVVAASRKGSGIKKYTLKSLLEQDKAFSRLSSKKYYTVVEVYLDTCAICKRLEAGFKPFLAKRKDVLIRKVNASNMNFSFQASSQEELNEMVAKMNARQQSYNVCGTPHVEVYAPKGQLIAADVCGKKTGTEFLRRWISEETGISRYSL